MAQAVHRPLAAAAFAADASLARGDGGAGGAVKTPPARRAITYLLVPTLGVGTQGCDALLRACHPCRARSRASRRAFPSRAWERETPMARTTHDALSPTGPQRVSTAVAVARRR